MPQPIDFSNTKIAFQSLSDKDLTQAYWLFKVIGNPSVVAMGPVMTDVALKLRLPIKGIIKKTIFSHFCGGETIKDSLARVQELSKYKVGTILDFAREGGGTEADFDAVVDEIKRTIDEAAKNPWIPFAVFKPTGVAKIELLAKKERGTTLTKDEQAAFDRVVARFEAICSHAHAKNIRIMIDAEESWIQNTVDSIAAQLMSRYNTKQAIVFNTLQMYRHDRLAFFEKAISAAKQGGYKYGAKLVRGAYLEKENRVAKEEGRPSPLNPSKAATDALYDNALRVTLKEIDSVALCAGTHNEASIQLLVRLMAEQGLQPDDARISFAQLLGMSDHISFNLAQKGYHVAKYVPYGTVAELLPYLTRRAQENSSVLGQSSRELSLLEIEKKRRRI